MVGKRGCRTDILAVNAVGARAAVALLRKAHPQAHEAVGPFDLGGHGQPRCPGAHHICRIGTAQTAARRQQRQRFENVGLARPIVTGQCHHRGVHAPVNIRIRADISEHKAADTGGNRHAAVMREGGNFVDPQTKSRTSRDF